MRLNGRVFEAVAARLERRPPCDLYHSALEVRVPEGRFVIEQAPVRDGNGRERGVVAEGAVGSRWAGRFRIFRYEVRRWRGGVIPDVDEAVESPQRLTDDPDARAARARPRSPGSHGRLGSRRARSGRDVELQLGDRLADRAQRPPRRVDPPPGRWARSRVACRARGRAPRDDARLCLRSPRDHNSVANLPASLQLVRP